MDQLARGLVVGIKSKPSALTFGLGTPSQLAERSTSCSISRTEVRYWSSLSWSVLPSLRCRVLAAQKKIEVAARAGRPFLGHQWIRPLDRIASRRRGRVDSGGSSRPA